MNWNGQYIKNNEIIDFVNGLIKVNISDYLTREESLDIYISTFNNSNTFLNNTMNIKCKYYLTGILFNFFLLKLK